MNIKITAIIILLTSYTFAPNALSDINLGRDKYPLVRILNSEESRASLDDMTQAPETLNKATLLHLGKNSDPWRHWLVQNAKNYVFITVPYWYRDESGKTLLARMMKLKKERPTVDIKVMMDWVSPVSTGDFFGTKMFSDLENAFGSSNVIQWNKLWNFSKFSAKVWKNRVHDKIFVIDGEKIIIGGMNIGDEYLQGGKSSIGWHDTDILLEGPAAQQGARYFLRPFLFQNYLDVLFNEYPDDERMELKVLHYIFNYGKDIVPYRPGAPLVRAKAVEIPLSSYEKNPRYFPSLKQYAQSYDTPVRLIYINPLVDRQIVRTEGTALNPSHDTSVSYNKFLNTLEYIMPYVKENMRLFIPYLTTSDRFTKILTSAAQRGITVEVLTNSLKSHDLGSANYKASLPRVRELEMAGVKVYEWQGHADLLELQKNNNCQITNYWPGRTLHTKAIVLDRQVAFLGSHNFNVRSDKYNSEIIAMIRSPKIAQQLYDIFEYDLDKNISSEQAFVQCGNQKLKRPVRSQRVNLKWLESVYDFKKLNKKKKWYRFL